MSAWCIRTDKHIHSTSGGDCPSPNRTSERIAHASPVTHRRFAASCLALPLRLRGFRVDVASVVANLGSGLEFTATA